MVMMKIWKWMLRMKHEIEDNREEDVNMEEENDDENEMEWG